MASTTAYASTRSSRLSTMFPLFDDPRKRKINLGGASSSATSNSILDQARSLRQAREKEKQKVEGAIKIQSWWRGVREGKEVRKGLVHVVEDAGVEDVGSLRVLRCLVIIGRKALTNRKNAVKGKAPAIASSGADLRRVLGIWSERVLEAGVDDALLRVSRESSPGGQQSWLVLIRQISAMLLWIGTTGESSGASRLNHLTVLSALLKSPLAEQELVPYILKHDYYTLLSAGVHSIPEPERSKSPLTPVLIELAVLPLTTLSASSNAEQHSYALTELLATIFAIPLLPNILPPTSITLLSSQTPFDRLHLLDLPRLMQETNSSQKMHLLATMMVFVTVKRWEMIRKKGGDAVKGYLNLMTALVNSLPAKTLRPPTTASKTANSMVFYPEADEDEPDNDDMDVDSGIRVTTVTSFATTPNARLLSLEKAPVPDAKTSKRIQTLTSPAYIHSLLPILSSPSLTTSLVPYLLSLSLAFPSSVPQSLLASSQGQGLIRELYRGSVRRSSIGKESSTIRSIGGKEAASDWPALLLLVELYGTSLMTMGDDEFFGTANNAVSSGSVHALGASGGSAGASSVSQSRNPLTLDELASFGRQLLNIAWVMWWQMGDLIKESESVAFGVGSEGVRRVGWESVRGRVTRCLTGIHARDSRKPFVPKDHWLVTPAQIGDVQGFVDAAVYEEHQLSEDPEALEAIQNALPTNLPPPRFSRSRTVQDQSARLSQHLTPRLGILNNLPFAIPFNLRVSIFRHFVLVDMNPAAVNPSFGRSSRRLPRPIRRHLPRMRRTQPDDGSVTPPRPSSLPLPRRRTRGAVSIDTGFGIEELIVDTDPEERRAIFGDQADSPIALMPGQPDQGHSQGVEEMVRRAQEEGRRVTIIPPGFEDGPGQPQTWDQAVTDIDNGMQAAVVNQMMGGGWRGKQRVQIRRTNVAQDGFDRLGDKDLKQPIEIVFLDQWGQEESGIDGGGLFKEFFTSLCKEVFDTDRGLWLANKKNELYPNPISYATESHSLEWYRFIGRILGKAMYDGILVDVAFAGFFLAKWLGKQSFLDDLASLDPDLYNGLVFLKHFNGNVEDLSLNFTVAIDEFGETKSIDLIPNGSNISVTRENRLQYIQLMSHYRLVTQIKKQSEAFFEGLSEMIDTRWIRMFNQQEVQVLIGGVNAPINLEDLRKHTNYGGLYDDDHAVIRAFWAVAEGFNQEQRMALLRFVTSCSRPPLLGFKELIPNFSIRDAGTDDLRLPTASTCVNLLKLPRYTTEGQLRQKLLQAINANAGFDLS